MSHVVQIQMQCPSHFTMLTVFLVAGQAGEAGWQTLQSEGPRESHTQRLDTREETGVLCLGIQGIVEFSLLKPLFIYKCDNSDLKVVLGLRGSNGMLEAQLDEVLIRNGVPNPAQIMLEESEKKEWQTQMLLYSYTQY